MTFPIIYNKQIDFQIFDRHSFGYNPQELSQVIKGRFSMHKGESFKDNIRVNFQGHPDPIGHVQLKLRTTSTIPQKLQHIMPKNQKLIIKSLIAHIPLISKKKIFISIKLGDTHRQTPVMKSHGGEVAFTEGIEMLKSSFVNEAVFQIFLIEAKGNQVKLIGKGVLGVEGSLVERKVELKDQEDKLIGSLFVNGRIASPKKLQGIESHNEEKMKYSTMDSSKLNRYEPIPAQESRISLYKSSLHPIQLSRLTPTSSLSLHPSLSRVSNTSSRLKKMTILHDNKEIVFPKQQRFRFYQDKQSDYISYLKERDSLVLKEKHSGRFYRGASIGKGEKTDFAQKGGVGIGEYNLPSIWDRY